MPLAIGQILKERYRIDQLLGQGGFGAVYRAWDATFELPCAIKENLEAAPEAQRQFLREARLLRNLRHPNLPQVTDYFVIEGQGGGTSTAYLVMDYVEGEDLQHKLEQAGGPLPVEQALQWVRQVCDALVYLHSQEQPVIHRDIKPANIRITLQGKAMLVDFGIAKLFDPSVRTTVGARAVTSGYSPPEQYGRGTTDAQSDVYALGATLYHLLSGQMPPDSMDIVSQNAPTLPPLGLDNPLVSLQVGEAVHKAMELGRERRFKSVAEFRAALTPLPPLPGAGEGERRAALAPQPPPPGSGEGEFRAATERVALQPEPAASSPYQTTPLDVTPVRAALAESLPIQGMGKRPLPAKWIAAAGGLALVILCGLAAVGLGSWLGGQNSATQTARAQQEMTQTVEESARQTAEAWQDATRTQEAGIAQTEQLRSAQTQTVQALVAQMEAGALTLTQAAAAGATQTAEAGGPIVDEYGVAMAYIPAGEFWMGSPDSDGNASSDEKPRHKVSLEAFYIDIYEVTNALYARCVQAGNCSPPHDGKSYTRSSYYGEAQYDDYPVIYVDWEQAQAFCEWRGARLPYEAEWEKAARGGLEGALYPWGNDDPVCQEGARNGAKFDDNAGCNDTDTEAVGSYAPNGYGLYDLAGNVWEWVMDWYLETFYASSPFENPTGPTSGQYRMLRGGSWNNDAPALRAANRDWFNPGLRDLDWGFRCAR